MLSAQLAVASNLKHRYMLCDNHFPRCGAEEETIIHAIFECPPNLHTWHTQHHNSTIGVPSASHYTNMDYLLWRKNDIEDLQLDKDPYPWIIWYIWKSRNDKLFRGIDMYPLETVRHAESEYHAWFEAIVKGGTGENTTS